MPLIPRRGFLRAAGAAAIPGAVAADQVPRAESRKGSYLAPPKETTPELRRGPYIQVQTHKSVVVRWRTDPSAVDCRLRFGDAPDRLDRVVQATKIPTPFEGVADWDAEVVNLQPARRYFYEVEASSAILAGGDDLHTFATAPEPGSEVKFRFLVLGDCGTNRVGTGNPGKALAARNGFRKFNAGKGPLDGILLLGDNAYSHGTDAQYQTALFSVYRDELAGAPTWPCIGNHELTDDCLEIFSVPGRGEAGGVPSLSRNYYSFDYANTHFVVLDLWKTEWRPPDCPQRRWLEADLAANHRRWTVVVNHFPPYCDGKYESDTNGFLVEVRQTILPVIESHGVDLLLTGHDHTYQRSYLLDGHHGTRKTFDPTRHLKAPGDGIAEPLVKRPGPHGGLIAVVTGTAGAPQLADPANPNGTTLSHPAMVKLPGGEQAGRGVRKLGVFLLEIEGDTLVGTQVGERGDTIDRFTLIKRPG